MTGFFLLLSLVLSPVKVAFTSDLVMDADYLQRRARAPHEGLLFTVGDVAQIQAEIKTSQDAYTLRLSAVVEQSQTELARVQAGFKLRIEGFQQRIETLQEKNSTLTLENLSLVSGLEQERAAYTRYRLFSYGLGAVLLGITTYTALR